MEYSYKYTRMIDSRDVDGHGFCKASALLGHLQEAATQAAEQSGFGRESLLAEYNAFWMLTRVWYQLERPLSWGEPLMVHTWTRGGRGAVSYRDYDLWCDGVKIGEGVAVWVLADLETRKLRKLSEVPQLQDCNGGALCKTKKLSKLKAPVSLEEVECRRMRYSDTDINGHVNNTRYADFACDALELDTLPQNQFLSGLQIGYLAECRPGEILTLRRGLMEDGCYICGVEGEVPRFEALLHICEKGEK